MQLVIDGLLQVNSTFFGSSRATATSEAVVVGTKNGRKHCPFACRS